MNGNCRIWGTAGDKTYANRESSLAGDKKKDSGPENNGGENGKDHRLADDLPAVHSAQRGQPIFQVILEFLIADDNCKDRPSC